MTKTNSETRKKSNELWKTARRRRAHLARKATSTVFPKIELSETEHIPLLNRKFKTLRSIYTDLNVSFVSLDPNTKKECITQDFNTLSNIGVRINSTSSLIVLDLDVKRKNSSLEKQLDYFSDFFDVNLRETLTVSTPSGGLHCYISLPNGLNFSEFSNFPKSNLSLDTPNKALKFVLPSEIVIDCDIRTSESANYFLAPTSSIDGVEYSVVDFATPILHVGDKGLENIKKTSDYIRDYRKNSKDGEKNSLVESKKINSLPHKKYIDAFEKSLNKTHSEKSFHSKRAKLFAAFSCCYSVEVLEELCIELEIDRDTYRKDRISQAELHYDVVNFDSSGIRHGSYCELGRNATRSSYSRSSIVYTEEAVQALLEHNQKRVAERNIARNPDYQRVYPRVLDIASISETLLTSGKGRKRRISQQYLDAMAVIENFGQPLSNVGVKIIVIARDAVIERLGVSSSRAGAALRLLRDSGILVIHSMPQVGLATTYTIPEIFTHSALTRSLRMAWGFNGKAKTNTDEKFHANLYLDRHSLTFREVFTNKPVKTNSNFIATKVQQMNSKVIEGSSIEFNHSTSLSYLKSEAIERGVEVIKTDSGYSMVDSETGEIIESAPLPKSVIEADNKDSSDDSEDIDEDSNPESSVIIAEVESESPQIIIEASEEDHSSISKHLDSMSKEISKNYSQVFEDLKNSEATKLKTSYESKVISLNSKIDENIGLKISKDKDEDRVNLNTPSIESSESDYCSKLSPIQVISDEVYYREHSQLEFERSIGFDFILQSEYEAMDPKRRPPPLFRT